jgi:hypothetical protein
MVILCFSSIVLTCLVLTVVFMACDLATAKERRDYEYSRKDK